jgi:ABC-type cobalamin/Fe3+-siderophores transport system ATPase subunit
MFLFNKKKKLTMICVAMFALCITVTHAVETIAELQIKPDTKHFEMKFNPQILQGSAYRETPCHVTSVYGKQGIMKSTLLRAISLFFNMEYGDFKSNNLSVATTTSIDISDVSHDNHLLIDTVGNDDPSYALSRGLDPLSVDLAFSKLVTPVSNVMIYVSQAITPSPSLHVSTEFTSTDNCIIVIYF